MSENRKANEKYEKRKSERATSGDSEMPSCSLGGRRDLRIGLVIFGEGCVYVNFSLCQRGWPRGMRWPLDWGCVCVYGTVVSCCQWWEIQSGNHTWGSVVTARSTPLETMISLRAHHVKCEFWIVFSFVFCLLSLVAWRRPLARNGCGVSFSRAVCAWGAWGLLWETCGKFVGNLQGSRRALLGAGDGFPRRQWASGDPSYWIFQTWQVFRWLYRSPHKETGLLPFTYITAIYIISLVIWFELL